MLAVLRAAANCHLSWDQINTGRDVGALSDGNPLFASSCGMCFEIRCQNAIFQVRKGQGYAARKDVARKGTQPARTSTRRQATPRERATLTRAATQPHARRRALTRKDADESKMRGAPFLRDRRTATAQPSTAKTRATAASLSS